MQICPECGTRNAAGAQFCSSCGTFLAWEDEQTPSGTGNPTPRRQPAPPPQPSRPGPDPAPSPPPSPERPPGSRHVRTSHNPDKVRRLPADPAEKDQVERYPVEPDDRTVALPRHTGQGHRSSSPSPPDGTERAGSPSTVRGPGPVPPSREPASVPPGDTQAPPPRPAEHEPEPSIAPGEVACPRCGAGNPPERHFCRRCATELRRQAPRAAPPPSRPPREGRSPLVPVLAVLAALLVLWLLFS